MRRCFRERFLITFCILFSTITAIANDFLQFEIANFEADPFDYSANDPQFEKFDGNGDKYSIIKVYSNNPHDNLNEFKFNFGNMKHIVEEHNGVLWIYVQRNAKRVTITREGYIPLNKYDLHTTIGSGKNYVMTLSTGDKEIPTQNVKFEILPENVSAKILIKNYLKNSPEELFGDTENSESLTKELEYGTYTYKVIAENYHTSEGKFKLNKKDETLIEKISLHPYFYDITLKVNGKAEIYLDGEFKGKGRWKGKLRAGDYQVECRQPNHNPSTQTITIGENDNKTFNLTAPVPIVGTVSITTIPGDSSIEIDGKSYGNTPQTLDLMIGKHTLILRKPGYIYEKGSFEVKENDKTDISVVLRNNKKPQNNLDKRAKTTVK